MIQGLRVVQRNALVYRRVWRGSLFTSFLQPALFLTAMGVGLGSRIDSGGAALPGGVPFLHFLAPGLLAAACMQTGDVRIELSRAPQDDVAAQLRRDQRHAASRRRYRLWRTRVDRPAAVDGRCRLHAGHHDVRRRSLGQRRARAASGGSDRAGVQRPGHGLRRDAQRPAATSTSCSGLSSPRCFSSPASSFRSASCPGWLEPLAWLTPLFHGVALTRALTLNMIDSPVWAVHLAYLLAMRGGRDASPLCAYRSSARSAHDRLHRHGEPPGWCSGA